jgi:hypothetical protein
VLQTPLIAPDSFLIIFASYHAPQLTIQKSGQELPLQCIRVAAAPLLTTLTTNDPRSHVMGIAAFTFFLPLLLCVRIICPPYATAYRSWLKERRHVLPWTEHDQPTLPSLRYTRSLTG